MVNKLEVNTVFVYVNFSYAGCDGHDVHGVINHRTIVFISGSLFEKNHIG